ncbi:MAG TPA: tetratricopeptide repeat protein [Tepidisphaeraceae bacterium]|jgi:tetratricopeptide (TPR) repeat protein
MSLRPKTVRRLAIILTAVAVLVGIGVGMYWRNDHVRRKRLAADRAAGIEAFKKGDYHTAMARLRPYIGKVQNDPDALYTYGASRFRSDLTRDDLSEARNRLITVLQYNPNHVEAQRELLDLYAVSGGYNTEVLELSEKLLKRDANDVTALRARCAALDRAHNFKEALALSERLNEIEPLDMDQQLRTYDLLRKLGKTPAELLERAIKLQQAHADDPRFEMLLGMSYGYAGDGSRGREMLMRAATRPAPDATFVRQMVRLFDSLGLYEQAEQMLQRTAKDNDPKLLRLLVQRLWQNRRAEEVVTRLKDLNPAAAESDATLIAFKALALFDLNRMDEARAAAAALATRNNDAQALAWSSALNVRFSPQAGNARRSVAQLQAAMARSPDNAVIRYLLGECYAQLGEYELAIGAWRRATDFSPSWATPHSEVALALASSGRFNEAVAEAQQAVKCAPEQVQPAATLAAVRFAQLEQNPDPAASKTLFDFVERVQKARPGEAQSLPAYVALLNRDGQRDKAVAVVQAVLQDSRKYDQTTLLRLAAISQKEKLALENELIAAAGREGDTPRAVLARATELATAGKVSEGLALLEGKAKAATTQPIQWELVLCQYREYAQQPEAAKDWIRLGDAHPGDLDVQTAILRSANSARSDRDFIARTIDRLRELTGPDGLTWKIERARWLIASEKRDKDSAEAVTTLNEVVRASPSLAEPRRMLAMAYENIGNFAAAAKELQVASELQPHAPNVALDAARLFQLQSRFSDTRSYIDRALTMKECTPEMRVYASNLLAQQGDYAAAAKVIEASPEPRDPEAQLALADLYVHQNRTADARTVYEKLLAASSPSAFAVAAAASFFAEQDSLERGTQTLNRLNDLKLPPGTAEFLRARFTELHQSPEQAQKLYEAATTAAPSDARLWTGYIQFRIRRQQFKEAAALADQATAALPKDANLAALRRVAVHFAAPAPAPIDLLSLADTFAATADHPAVQQLIGAVETAAIQKLTPEATLASLRKVVDSYPRFAALQLALVQWCVKLNQLDEAAKLATRAAEQFPANPDAPRIAANVYRLMKKWDLAARAAQQWRERAGAKSIEADIFLANIRLQLKEPATALKVLQPHLAHATDKPGHKLELAVAAARAYAASNRADEAQKLLEPLLSDRAGRMAWLSVAASDLASADLSKNWIEKVAPLIPADSQIEQQALANAWYTAGARFASKPMLENAAKVLEPVAARPDASPEALSLRGLIAEQSGDARTAESLYRRSLQVHANQAGTLNNLAYLILCRGGDMTEAKNFSSRALALAPETPEFLDTLARIHVKAGDLPAAMDSFQRALRLDPNNLHALIGLASAYTASGKKEPAANMLNQIDLLLKVHPGIPQPLRQELDSLRATVRASIQ